MEGNVGIGTVSPENAKLQINSDAPEVGNIGIGGPIYRDMWFDGGTDGIFVFYNKGASTGATSFNYDPDPLGNAASLMFIKNDGNVGIGTMAPEAKLEVAGQIKITGGSPGIGKVLTSDQNGLASWQRGINILDSPVLLGSHSNCTQFGARSWYTIDVSNFVPATATAVLLRGLCGEDHMCVRATGSGLLFDDPDRLTIVCWAGDDSTSQGDYIVKLDAQKKFQWANEGTDCNSVGARLYLRGWM